MSLPPGLIPIAHQLHAALLVEIDHEIEIERLVSDGRYARDVLLVCDACPATGLPQLAAQFRALVPPPTEADEQAHHAQVMDVPPSIAMRALAAAWAPDSGSPADPAIARAARPPRAPAQHTAQAAPASPGSRLQRWWARLRGG